MTFYAKCSPQEKAYVDKTASDLSRWTLVGQSQLDALRETPEARDATIQRLTKEGRVGDDDWQWPREEDAENCVSQWSDICDTTPQSIEE